MTIVGAIKPLKGMSSPMAHVCAVVRAAETRRPRRSRLLSDPYARYFLHNWYLRLAYLFSPVLIVGVRRANQRYTGLIGGILLRQRHCDEVIAAEVSAGCRQVVVLGAGYDTTALRASLAPDSVVYEVDKSDTQAEKIEILHRNGLRPKHPVRYVGCDFDAGDDVAEGLLSSGFDPERPCVVLWMGVTYYLSRASVESTLDRVASISAPGSTLVLDYMDSGVVDGTLSKGAQRAKQLVATGGEPFILGLDGLRAEDFFGGRGFDVSNHSRIPEILDAYGDPRNFWLTAADCMGVITLRRSTSGADLPDPQSSRSKVDEV